MAHVLRKSVGPFSAGTHIKVYEQNADGSFPVEVLVKEPDSEAKDNSYDYEDMTFDCEAELILEIRNKVDEVPIHNRRSRRASARKVADFINNKLGA